MNISYNDENKVIIDFSHNLQENIDALEMIFNNCNDYVKRKITIGGTNKVDIYLAYTDNMVDRNLLEYSIIKNLLFNMDNLPFTEQYDYIIRHGIQTADFKEVQAMDDISQSIITGDVVLLIDGYQKGLAISLKDFPGRGVSEVANEVTIKGPKDSFTESIAINTVLIRRRIKDTHLKMESLQVGIRSRTSVTLSYITGIVDDKLVDKVKSRINSFVIDGIFDVGMLEQLTEKAWYSPFPQYQSTERPDKAASALMEGRIAILVDNSPMVLLLPVTINSFFQASDDYYRHWEIASFVRMLRYIGAFLAITLPGLYIAVCNYQLEMIPTPLVLSFAEARQGVPFSILMETVILQLVFELLTEAGIRLPSPMGNTIGIVGGLIIGQSAISANLVSPLVVIVVAFTAIASCAIPNETFTSAFRILRYALIALAALFGLYGMVIGIVTIFIHLAGLKSFGIPYLSPFAATSKGNTPLRDSIVKYPIFKMKNRPIYANEDEKVRFKKK